MTTSELSTIATIRSNSDKLLTVYQGYNDHVVEQLVVKSQEEDIRQRCRKDAESRFPSVEAFYTWVHKGIGGRALYPVIDDETGDLGGVVWLGIAGFTGNAYRWGANGGTSDELMPDVDPNKFALGEQMSDTFALRTYESQKSQGVGRKATIQAIAHYAAERTLWSPVEYPVFTGIHLETDIDNLPARKIYQNLLNKGFGFTPIAESLHKNRIAMVLPEADIEPVINVAQLQASREAS